MSGAPWTKPFAMALLAMAAFPAGAQEGQGKKGVDSFGDPLPAGAFARIGTARLRAGLEISGLEFSPDGTMFASSGLDDAVAVRLWDTSSATEIRKLVPVKNPNGTSSLVYPFAFSADGKYVVGSSLNLHLWEVSSGRDLRQWGDLAIQIRALSFSPDGTLVAAGDSSNGIRLYEAASGTERRVMKTQPKQSPYGLAMAFSPDGKTLATGGEDRNIHLWDVETGEDRRTCLGHSNRILSLAWSPDGKTLASGSSDKTVRLWDADLGQEVRKFEGHQKDVTSVHFSPDGHQLISSDYGCSVRFWDPVSGVALRRLDGHALRSSRVAFSRDGKKYALASHAMIQVRDLATDKDLFPTSGHEREIQALTFSPDGRSLFSQGGDDTVRSWAVESRQETSRILDHVSAGGAMAVAGNGRSLAVGTWNDIFLQDLGEKAAEKKERWKIKAREKGSICLAFAPDGRMLAWAVGMVMNKEDHTVHLVNAETGEEVRVLKGHRGAVSALAFASDGKTIATSSASYRGENSIRFWDVQSGSELRKFDALKVDSNRGFVRGYVAFSPDLSMVGSSDDRSLTLRDGATGKECARVECGAGLGISAVVFSPDGRFVAAAESKAELDLMGKPEKPVEQRIRVLEVATASPILSFENAQGRTSALAFSPDGRTLVSGGHDTTILFWDLSGPASKAPPSADFARLWGELADPDGKKAWQASGALAAAGDAAVGFVALHLRPARMDSARVNQWISDLSSPSVAVQLKGSKMLGQALELAGTRAAIQKALEGKPSEEVRARLETLLAMPQDQAGSRSPEELRRGRALHLLEQLSSPKAREALRALAEGESSGLSREARAALGRIEARSVGK